MLLLLWILQVLLCFCQDFNQASQRDTGAEDQLHLSLGHAAVSITADDTALPKEESAQRDAYLQFRPLSDQPDGVDIATHVFRDRPKEKTSEPMSTSLVHGDRQEERASEPMSTSLVHGVSPEEKVELVVVLPESYAYDLVREIDEEHRLFTESRDVHIEERQSEKRYSSPSPANPEGTRPLLLMPDDGDPDPEMHHGDTVPSEDIRGEDAERTPTEVPGLHGDEQSGYHQGAHDEGDSHGQMSWVSPPNGTETRTALNPGTKTTHGREKSMHGTETSTHGTETSTHDTETSMHGTETMYCAETSTHGTETSTHSAETSTQSAKTSTHDIKSMHGEEISTHGTSMHDTKTLTGSTQKHSAQSGTDGNAEHEPHSGKVTSQHTDIHHEASTVKQQKKVYEGDQKDSGGHLRNIDANTTAEKKTTKTATNEPIKVEDRTLRTLMPDAGEIKTGAESSTAYRAVRKKGMQAMTVNNIPVQKENNRSTMTNLGAAEMEGQQNSTTKPIRAKKFNTQTLLISERSHQRVKNMPRWFPSVMDTQRWDELTGSLSYADLLSRYRRQESGHSFSSYTADGETRKPVSLGTCLCPRCNKTESVYLSGQYENVAFNKPMKESSYLTPSYPACSANNGETDRKAYIPEQYVNFYSCTGDLVPWLILDMEYVVTFQSIIIYRFDGPMTHGQEKLLAVDILADGRLIYAFPRYTNLSGVANLPLEINIRLPTPETARYVTFQKRDETDGRTTSNYYFALSDIRIWVCKPGTYGSYGKGCKVCPSYCYYPCDNHYGCVHVLHNVAIRKKAYQSQVGVGSASNLVDALKPTSLLKTCTHQSAQQSWYDVKWWVELGALYRIFSVAITARVDCCGEESLRNFWVLVLNNTASPNASTDADNLQLCFREQGGVGTKQRIHRNCVRNITGTFVMVYSKGDLGFCEFEAFGYRIYGLPFGSQCNLASQFLVCDDNSVCQGGKCVSLPLMPCYSDADCAQGSVCDLNKCRLTYNTRCDPNKTECRADAFCDEQSRSCKIRLGNKCPHGQENVCTLGAKCDVLKRCGLVRNSACQNTLQCTAGAHCYQGKCTCKDTFSVPDNEQCRPQPGRIGSRCDNSNACAVGLCQNGVCTCDQSQTTYFEDFSCKIKAGSKCGNSNDCDFGLVCENSQCYIKEGHSCYGNKEFCKTGTTCFDDICALKTRESCRGSENLCIPGNSCSAGICKIVLGVSCQNEEQYCQSGSCSGADNSTCRINTGQPCGQDTARFCRTGSFCENGAVCKLVNRAPCNTDGDCRQGTRCRASLGSNEKYCRLVLGSVGCTGDDCEAGTACDALKQCSIVKGGSCWQHPSLCIQGAQCYNGTCQCIPLVTDVETKNCDIKPRNIGGTCNASADSTGQPCNHPWALCSKDGLCVCGEAYATERSSLECRLLPGSQCVADRNCTKEAVCDVGGVCALKVGQPCHGDLINDCRIGSLCDVSRICRLDIHQNCVNYTTDCRENTTCDLLLRCKRKPGKDCREDEECMAGSHCDLTTRLCECTEAISTHNGVICVPNKGIVGGLCLSGNCYDTHAVCSPHSGRCQCLEGYIGEPYKLSCAKDRGQACTRDDECAAGLICDSVTRDCRIQVGQMCDGGNKEFCKTGTICEFDNVCRLDLMGDCSGDNSIFCKPGTFCDWLDVCRIGYGDSCTITDKGEETCVAGALCVDGVCFCNLSLSSVYGAVCEPDQGRFGGTCEAGCVVSDSRCVNGICTCIDGFKPTRNFTCDGESLFELLSSVSTALLLAVILGVTALVLLLAAAEAYWRRQHRNAARSEVAAHGIEAMRQIDLIKKDVSDIMKAEEAEIQENVSESVSEAASAVDSITRQDSEQVSALENISGHGSETHATGFPPESHVSVSVAESTATGYYFVSPSNI